MTRSGSSNPGSRNAFRSNVAVTRATGALPKRADQRIGERTAPFLQRDHRSEHLLLVLHDQFRRLQQALDDGRNIRGTEPIGALEHPGRLDHRHDTDEARILFAEPPLDQFGCEACL